MPCEANPPQAASPAHPLAERALAVFVAQDERTRLLLAQLRKIAATNATVLIQGESGTGKDLAASLLHYLGPRPEEPLLKIDCAALPPSLMESELFGYERGAFTGASSSKRGRLELAGEGTIVLDEVAALSLPMQAKLLRVLEERSFVRLGATHPVHISPAVRIVATSNSDLAALVARRIFRDDLYYRLHVVPLLLPPLRERRDDILPLANFFLDSLAAAHAIAARSLSSAAEKALLHYNFPGNLRELRNLMERLLLNGGPPEVSLQELPAQITAAAGPAAKASLQQMERDYIAEVLDFTRGSKSRAAEILGITRKTLLEKRKRYGLD